MSSPASAPAAPCTQPGNASRDGHALADSPARQAARAALKAVDAARDHGHPIVLCEALTDAARCLAALHAYTQSDDYLTQALHWAGVLQSADLRADLMCALAEVACNEADLSLARHDATPDARAGRERARERGRDWAFQAAALAHRTSDPTWEMKVLLRASDVLERGGDHDDAVRLQTRAMALLGLGALNQIDIDLDADGFSDASAGALQVTGPAQLM